MAEGENTDSVSKAEYQKQVERAQRFEAKLTDLEKTLERFNSLGDIEDVKAKLLDLDRISKDKAKVSDEDLKKLLSDTETKVRNELQKELDKRDGLIKEKDSALTELKVVDKVFSVLSSDLTEGADTHVKRMIRENCALDEHGNVIIKGPDGKPRYKEGSAGVLMTPEDFKSELLTKEKFFFKPQTVSGAANGNKSTTGQDTGGVTLEKFQRMTRSEQLALPGEVRAAFGQQILQHR